MWSATKMSKGDYVVQAVRHLVNGQPWKVEADDIGNYYIVVQNPDFKPEKGNRPNFVLTVNENEIHN